MQDKNVVRKHVKTTFTIIAQYKIKDKIYKVIYLKLNNLFTY